LHTQTGLPELSCTPQSLPALFRSNLSGARSLDRVANFVAALSIDSPLLSLLLAVASTAQKLETRQTDFRVMI
jgi:hypothetical protein